MRSTGPWIAAIFAFYMMVAGAFFVAFLWGPYAG